jgi:hypothetical protein
MPSFDQYDSPSLRSGVICFTSVRPNLIDHPARSAIRRALCASSLPTFSYLRPK